MLIVRDGKEMTVNVTTKEMPHDYRWPTIRSSPGKSSPETPKADNFADLGIEIEAASRKSLQKLGYKGEPRECLVTSVKDDSPAEQGRSAGRNGDRESRLEESLVAGGLQRSRQGDVGGKGSSAAGPHASRRTVCRGPKGAK